MTGKGYGPRVTPLGNWRVGAYLFLTIYELVAMVLPLALIALTSVLTLYNPEIHARHVYPPQLQAGAF